MPTSDDVSSHELTDMEETDDETNEVSLNAIRTRRQAADAADDNADNADNEEEREESPIRRRSRPNSNSETPATGFARVIVNTQKIQEEAQIKESMQAPKNDLDSDDKLSDHTDLLQLISWFLKVNQKVSRKTWCSSIEQWVIAQIKPASVAHFFITSSLDSGTFPQQRSGCFFLTWQHFKKSIVKKSFEGHPLSYIIRTNVKLVRLNHSAPASAAWACTSAVTLANKVRELYNYLPENLKLEEENIVGEIRAMLPLSVQKEINQYEIQREAGPIKIFSDLILILTRIDSTYKPEKEKKGKEKSKREAEVSLNNVNTKKQKGKGKNIPVCSHCNKKGHEHTSCFILHPELKPKFLKEKKEKREKEQNSYVNKVITEKFEELLASISAKTSAKEEGK